jgi:hypothetical protein
MSAWCLNELWGSCTKELIVVETVLDFCPQIPNPACYYIIENLVYSKKGAWIHQSEAVDSILNFVSLSCIVGLQAEVRFILDDAMQTVRFKNELERNITIKLGYANAKIYKCEDERCPRPMAYKYGCEHNPRDRLMYQEACTIDCKQHNSFVISSSLLYIWREC